MIVINGLSRIAKTYFYFASLITIQKVLVAFFDFLEM